jgi:coenzyme F420-reducing hydrogenase beta subunit
MIKTIDSSKCTGCEVCASLCPAGAIRVYADDDGFLVPYIADTLCTSCGACQRVCPAGASLHVLTDITKIAYAAYNRSMEERTNSSSGGIFILLAKQTIRSGGVVYGAAFDSVSSVSHRRIDNPVDLHLLQKSKYLQSHVGDTYKQCKGDLATGKPVLFTGTPCQIAGLKSFLGKVPENLFTMDIVCHGVPSGLIWEKHLRAMGEKQKSNVINVDFRCKIPSWKDFSVFYSFEDGSKLCIEHEKDAFFHGFNSGLFLRQSCYQCLFKAPNDPADISLGDFWACSTMAPVMDDGMGSSIILVNTEKGRSMFNRIKSEVCYLPINYKLALDRHAATRISSSGLDMRKQFYDVLPSSDFRRLVFHFAPRPKSHNIRKCTVRFLKKIYHKLVTT